MRRWQTYALAAAAIGLAAVIHHAYATVYTEPDLWVWWSGARLWLGGVDPYGPAGDAALGTASGFAYPFPAVLLSAPFALLPLAWAATAWALLSLAAALSLPAVVQERPPAWAFALMLAYFPLWASLEEAQWGPVLLLFALLSVRRLHRGRPAAAGFVLPLVLLKPQVGIALLAAVALYALRAGAGGRWWAGLVLGGLVWWGGSLLIAPGWPLAWLEQLRAYESEAQNVVDARALPGALALALALGAAIIAWWRRDATLVLAAALPAALLLLPTRSFYNQAVLLLPLALISARAPLAAALAAGLSWAVVALALAGGDPALGRALCLYLPLAAALLWAVRVRPARVERDYLTTAAAPPSHADRVQ